MTKGQLPKAYLRLDPNIDQIHPDPGAMARLLCVAARQPQRGRFKSRAVLELTLGKRLVQVLIDRGDVIEEDDHWYVPGWDEWQEGDWTVSERQSRIRARKARKNVTPPVADRDTSVTSPLPDSDAPPVALGSKALGSKAFASALSARDGLPHITPAVQEAGEAITGHGLLSAGDRQLTELDRLVEAHGPDAVVGAFRAVSDGGSRTWRQLVWDSMKRLEPFARPLSPKDAEAAEKEEARRRFLGGAA